MADKFLLEFDAWDDGELVPHTLDHPDRWAVHTAERVRVTLPGGLSASVVQSPRDIPAKRVGVGAVLWDGAMVLSGHLATWPAHRLVGARVVELGAGVGLVGVVAALRGATVVVTDIEKVLPLLQQNLEANGFGGPGGVGAERRGGAAPGEPSARALELEWGKPGWLSVCDALASPPLDIVVAADVCYVDGDGESPSTAQFVQTCERLCTPGRTILLVAQERRAESVRTAFMRHADEVFASRRLLSPAGLPEGLRAPHIDVWELRR